MMSPLSNEAIKRFWKNIPQSPNGGCWEWAGTLDKNGYGVLTVDGKKLKAHRLSYQINCGSLSVNDLVLHSCDNPRCVCPTHLLRGTPKTNALDRANKGRSARHQGKTNGRAKLTETQVLEIRRTYQPGIHTKRALAREYHVTDVLIGKIVRRELWNHLGD